MHTMRSLLAVATLLVVIVGAAPARADVPPVFSDLSYDAAIAASDEDDGLLLVDATAVWCGPCKMMDRTTWVDKDVVAWIEAHGRAIQVDVDRQRTAARAMRIAAMPTVVAYRDGKEIDRVVGYRSGPQILSWLDGLGKGETALDRTRAEAGSRDGKDVDVGKRLELARTLVQSGRLDEATDEYAWLWAHILEHDPSMYGVRLSFMATEMKRLASQHEKAKTTFRAIRDELTPAVEDGSANRTTAIDWLHLCEIIADDDAVLGWWERSRDDPKRRPDADRMAADVFELFVARNRWADAGTVFRAPTAHFRSVVRRNQHALAALERSRPDDAEMLATTRDATRRRVRTGAAQLHAALLAAGRRADAREIARLLFVEQNDADARVELVRQALAAGVARPEHRTWLDDAESRGADVTALRAQLDAALDSGS